MTQYTRRSVLTLSVSVLGGLALGVQSQHTGSYLVDAKRVSAAEARNAGLTVIHDLSAIDVFVVHRDDSAVDTLGAEYAHVLTEPPDSVSDNVLKEGTVLPATGQARECVKRKALAARVVGPSAPPGYSR